MSKFQGSIDLSITPLVTRATTFACSSSYLAFGYLLMQDASVRTSTIEDIDVSNFPSKSYHQACNAVPDPARETSAVGHQSRQFG
jgi:hypothetical protein